MPIACDLYSQLELAAMRGQTVELYANNDLRYRGPISTLATEKGKEYLVTPEQQKIPLEEIDRIETLN
ncbi:Rho-binding antiterminator [Thiomicrorhabdus xiamenensis]|uniref:Rho-binding antiterminator n=1 Tax=Thiomicrorhabdus xiamenensis TaxID=2739063 RepID=A0A7D4NLH4_9GAMM|nr:Rho-binding antiterminator [Thiomicrorhabdus xiamenensis]QKI90169.1 hypothetical protein HQN79_11575 [Thiomicrorhabdus xiamenensis]